MPTIRASSGFAATMLLLAAAPAAAQDIAQQVAREMARQVEVLAWLNGLWRGPGTMFGQASEATLEVRPARGGAVLELSYRAGRFEGRAIYRPILGPHWQGQWTDNRGVSMSIQAYVGERTLTANWNVLGGEQGVTVYRLEADGRLHVTDSVHRPGENMSVFASHILTRAE